MGEGYHDHLGGSHAEVIAIYEAGDRTVGATLYCTLEPCHHTGRTPPCTRAILAAGISRVVVGCLDPNPTAKGGIDFLRQQGVDVIIGFDEAGARAVNEMFLVAHERKRPVVTVKAAITLDGKIAWPNGESKWITGEAARAAGHALRAQSGAVLVGRKTVESDNPSLTARIPGVVNQPLRVILDPRGLASEGQTVFQEDGHFVWYVKGAPELDAQTPLDPYSVPAILDDLYMRGQIGLLVEGGGQTIRHFLEAGVVDKLILYVAPKIFGRGIEWLPTSKSWYPSALELIPAGIRQLGDDVELTFQIPQE